MRHEGLRLELLFQSSFGVARHGLVVEVCFECVIEWHAIAEHIPHPLLALQIVRVLCHPQTRWLLVQLDSEVEAHDVYCICGRRGSERSGHREWVAFQLESLLGWPTFSYDPVCSFVPCH